MRPEMHGVQAPLKLRRGESHSVAAASSDRCKLPKLKDSMPRLQLASHSVDRFDGSQTVEHGVTERRSAVISSNK